LNLEEIEDLYYNNYPQEIVNDFQIRNNRWLLKEELLKAIKENIKFRGPMKAHLNRYRINRGHDAHWVVIIGYENGKFLIADSDAPFIQNNQEQQGQLVLVDENIILNKFECGKAY